MQKQELLELLTPFGQTHLLDWWDALTSHQQAKLAAEIRAIDFDLVTQLIAIRDSSRQQATNSRAERAVAPAELIRLNDSNQAASTVAAAALGERLLADGKVAAILVAGGQGSRLGFEAPKGTFPIGPVSDRTLFQVLCEQVLARSRRAGCDIPYLIMTSAATHTETVDFFRAHQFFGLPANKVFFFQQASLPAIEAHSHRVLMADRDAINLSPDGHGGVLRALQKSGLLAQMTALGIEHFYYHQVDNPTAIVLDPVFLGLHSQQHSDMTTKVVAKVHPHEKMGVVVTVDGRTEIIEYSDLTPAQAERLDAQGQPVFWAGNTAIHAFRVDFLQRLAHEDAGLPYHVANKSVSCLNREGLITLADPKHLNSHKFEQFIFDALPMAQVALVVEADRDREFNPVKNATGNDSPETSRQALLKLAYEWVIASGATVNPGTKLEISPLFALDSEECQRQLPPGRHFETPTILE